MSSSVSTARQRRRWASPVRWGILAGVLASLAVMTMVVFEADRMDVFIPAIIAAGIFAGAFAGARVVAMRWGTPADPRRGKDPQKALWTQYSRMARDVGFAVAWGLPGGIVLGVIAMAHGGGRSPSDFFVPFLLALIWWLAYGLTLIAALLIWIPVSIGIEGWRSRRGE